MENDGYYDLNQSDEIFLSSAEWAVENGFVDAALRMMSAKNSPPLSRWPHRIPMLMAKISTALEIDADQGVGTARDLDDAMVARHVNEGDLIYPK